MERGFNNLNDIQGDYFFAKGDCLEDYTIISIKLKNNLYLKESLGESRYDKFLLYYCKELEKLLTEEEQIALSNNQILNVIIKKENVSSFLKFKDLIVIPFNGDKEICYFDIVTRSGIYNIEKTDSITTALEKAKMALEAAENDKVDSMIFTEELKKKFVQEQRILSIFPSALKNSEFTVYYQPKIYLKDNKLCGSEALVRWKRNNEIIFPNEFVPVLEKENMIWKLDFYILEQVCKDIRKWLDAGLNPVKTSINFSKTNLSDPCFSDKVLSILKKYDIDSQFIEVELTETTDAMDYTNMIKLVETMKKNNINVSIDDFGTGYSSLNLVKCLAANTIKIDKTFVDNIQNKKDAVVIMCMISIALQLGIDIIAEGAETKEQVEILYSMGCDKIQGYYFDRPLPKEEYETRLINKNYEKKFKLAKN